MFGGGEPIVVSISHRLGRDEAKRRIERGFDSIRRETSPFVASLDCNWTDYRLDFDAVAVRQHITGNLEVFDEFIRIELVLPGLLHLLGKTIAGRIERRGADLLEGPKT